MGIIFIKKLLIFLGTAAVGTSCAVFMANSNQKYNYFLVKSNAKINDINLMLEPLDKEGFDLKTIYFENNKTHTTSDFDIFELISNDTDQYIFDLNNFSEEHNKINNFSKIQKNHFYLLKMPAEAAVRADLTKNKFEIMTNSSNKKYYDFDLVYPVSSKYADFSSSHLFGKITNLREKNVNPELIVETSTDYKCNGKPCKFNLFKTNSSEPNKNDWEQEIQQVSSYQSADTGGSSRFFVLEMTGNSFKHNNRPDSVEITFNPLIKPVAVATNENPAPPEPTPAEQKFYFETKGILYKSKDQADWSKYFKLM